MSAADSDRSLGSVAVSARVARVGSSGTGGSVRAVIGVTARWTPARSSGPEGSTARSVPLHASVKVAAQRGALQEGGEHLPLAEEPKLSGWYSVAPLGLRHG